jgi:hypothetical protein
MVALARRVRSSGSTSRQASIADGAARMEPAAGGHVDRVGRLSTEDLDVGAVPGIPTRHDREQCLRVRVPRVLDDLARRASSTIRPRYITQIRSAKREAQSTGRA